MSCAWPLASMPAYISLFDIRQPNQFRASLMIDEGVSEYHEYMSIGELTSMLLRDRKPLLFRDLVRGAQIARTAARAVWLRAEALARLAWRAAADRPRRGRRDIDPELPGWASTMRPTAICSCGLAMSWRSRSKTPILDQESAHAEHCPRPTRLPRARSSWPRSARSPASWCSSIRCRCCSAARLTGSCRCSTWRPAVCASSMCRATSWCWWRSAACPRNISRRPYAWPSRTARSAR